MSTFLIREARRDDAGTIVGFQIAMARETENVELQHDTVARGVAAVFDEPSLGRYYVAEIDDQVVASLLITYEWSDWRNGTVWWIQSVYTRPEYRRRGVYASLYAHIRGRVEMDASVRGIRLYVDNTNTEAQKVYTRLGMQGEHYKVFEWMR